MSGFWKWFASILIKEVKALPKNVSNNRKQLFMLSLVSAMIFGWIPCLAIPTVFLQTYAPYNWVIGGISALGGEVLIIAYFIYRCAIEED